MGQACWLQGPVSDQTHSCKQLRLQKCGSEKSINLLRVWVPWLQVLEQVDHAPH